MNWVYVGLAGLLVVGVGVGFALFARRMLAGFEGVQAAVASSQPLEKDLLSQLAPEAAARIAAVERRMEQLEQDALTYLRKGSQRYEQARRREARLNQQEEAEEEEAPPEDREEFERAILSNREPEPGGDGLSLHDIRARITRGGR